MTSGTLLDMQEAHMSSGKILNLLDLPMAIFSGCLKGLSSDCTAFQKTLQGPMCKKRVEYPVVETVWGLAATTGAVSVFHLDANGFVTWINIAGAKYGILGQAKEAP
jgi:hypothetical protein